MARLTGKNLYVEFDGTALNTDYRTLDVSYGQDTAQTTAGADEFRNYANTVKTIEATFEAVVDEFSGRGSAFKALLIPGSEGTLIWGEEGTAAGKPKDGYLARITTADKSYGYESEITYSVTFQMAGTELAFDSSKTTPDTF